MIANRVRITVIFCDVTWEDLFACACCEYVPCQAGTLVRVRAGICTVPADTARITDAVVNVFARDSVSGEAVRTRIAQIAFERGRLIVATYTIEARCAYTIVPIGAVLAASSVACIACAGVQPWAGVAADRI
jgi:hypothetical protein